MPMNLARPTAEQGSALVISLVGGVLIGTVLCSYLVMINSRDTLAMRATSWNAAMPVLEAGVEEALTHLNRDSNNPTANNWTATQVGGQTAYWKQRTLPDGSYFCVTNFNVGTPSPFIQSAGYVASPLNDGQFISRVVQVNLTNPPSEFSRPIAANGPVQLNSLDGSALIDGYNSAVGPYDTSTNRDASGGIATNSKQPGAINISGAHVYGTAVTGPGGTISVSSGSVGDIGWNAGIQDGWTGNNMNVSFQPNSPPPAQGPTYLTPAFYSGNGSNVTYLSGGTYKLDNFVSNDRTRPLIVTGDSTLWIPGNFVVAGSGFVYINPGAHLNLYLGNPDPNVRSSAAINGGGIVNGTGVPSNLSIYGLPGNTAIRYSGQADLVGTVNAPQASFALSGGASVFGAVICNTFTLTGNSQVHYDRALAGPQILIVTGWREL